VGFGQHLEEGIEQERLRQVVEHLLHGSVPHLVQRMVTGAVIDLTKKMPISGLTF
jgi:hypothetical protein